MLEEKGDHVANWNWQMREHRTMDEINEEQEYLKHVEDISHIEEKSGVEGAKYNSNCNNNVANLSTKESSEHSLDQVNSKFFR